MYTAGVLAVVLIVVIAGSVVILDIHPKSSATSPNLTVLVPKDTLYIIPYEQFDSSVFTINGTATVNGTIDQTGGINVYTMTPEQVFDLARSGTVSGYEWMTSLVTNGTVYAIDLTFGPGTWNVVFFNPNTNPNNSSSVGFLTGLYLLQT